MSPTQALDAALSLRTLIEEEANVKWLSTGVLLREKASAEQQDRMEKGDLLEDAEVEDILHEAISEVSNGTRILIDGFPRRDSQIQWCQI